jgi:4-oxalocrotonate tautomerase
MPVVRVTWFSGKDAAAKQAVAQDITQSIVQQREPTPSTST